MFSRLPRFSPLSTNAACGKARAHSLFVLIVSFTPRALAVPGVSLLLYGKSQPRPGPQDGASHGAGRHGRGGDRKRDSGPIAGVRGKVLRVELTRIFVATRDTVPTGSIQELTLAPYKLAAVRG